MEFKLSPSSLSLMHECPRCFWLTQYNVWKRPAGVYPDSLCLNLENPLFVNWDNINPVTINVQIYESQLYYSFQQTINQNRK